MSTLLAFIIVIGPIIFIHELGHYLAARSVGVRVEKFSIGFPPRLFSFTSVPDGWLFSFFFYRKGDDGKLAWLPIFEKRFAHRGRKGSGTEYCFATLPFGGYVKMAGLIDESMDADIKHEPYELMSKPRWAQAWVMSAGVIMNIIMAIVIFSSIAFINGKAVISNEPVIAQIIEELPAELAGLQSGDRIIEINGTTIETWDDITLAIHPIPDSPINMEYEREGNIYEIDLVSSSQPIIVDGNIDTVGMIGIAMDVTYEPINVFQAVGEGWKSTKGVVGLIGMTIKMLVSGAATFKDIGGPIFIAQMAGEAAEAGWMPIFGLMGLISVNLALINIFPLPGLDGGHILIITIEGIIRRPLNLKLKMAIQQVGMLFLMALMVLVFWNDIVRAFFEK